MEGHQQFSHTDVEGRAYDVRHWGSGPPVVIIHELAGISPELVRFADRVARAGFSVYLPALVPRPTGPLKLLVASVRVCISAEFVKLARGRTSPVVTWLRSLARRLHDESGGPVGVVGMCLTGGFALAMAVDEHVVAPVMAHPTLPLGIGSRRRRDLGLDDDHLASLRGRQDLQILGVRFSKDLVAPAPRFDRMQEEFGVRFIRCEVTSGFGSPLGLPPWAHSVLNNPALDSDDAKDARVRAELDGVVDDVVDFLVSRLRS